MLILPTHHDEGIENEALLFSWSSHCEGLSVRMLVVEILSSGQAMLRCILKARSECRGNEYIATWTDDILKSPSQTARIRICQPALTGALENVMAVRLPSIRSSG